MTTLDHCSANGDDVEEQEQEQEQEAELEVVQQQIEEQVHIE